MSDKIEYSRLVMKRSDVTGVVPTIPTGTTLSSFTDTDLFVGEFFLNAADDVMWIRTDNGILPISLSGSTGTTIPTLTQVLYEGNTTNGFDVVVSSGDTIQFLGIPSGVTSTILGIDASGNTITTTGGGGTQDLSQVLAQGNITNGYDIVVSTGDTISSPSGENEISLQDTDSLLLQSTYTLSGTNYKEQIRMRAPSPSDASLELISYDLTNNPISKTEYRPTSIKDFSFDSVGSFVETRLESSGFTIDLSNTSAGYLTIDGLLPGTATDLLGIDSNNRVVPVDISGLTTPNLSQVLSQGNTTNGNDIIVSSGDTIQYQGLTTGITTDFLAIDGFGNTIITSGGANGTSGTSGTSGSSGINGTNGTSGINGTNGTSGINGTNGTSGSSGVSGTNGTSGTSGVNGDAGSSGTSGVNGANGTSGTSGVSGTNGTSGVNGANGTSGTSGVSPTALGSFGITIDGGGSAITTGVKGYIIIPYNCTITGWTILGDVSGSIVVDVWKDTYANFPPTVADTIAGSEKPTLSSQTKNQDNALSTWTTSVSSGDIIGFNVDSASTVTRVNLSINVIKS